jgi:hypothetical protein
MASELFAARSDFASLGSSLASVQQNAMADQISNNAAIQNYNNVSAQLKASIPSGFGDIAFGAYELLGQGKDLVGRLSKVKDAVAAAPDALKAALVKGGNKLGARGGELKSLVSDTTDTLKTTGDALKTAATGGAEQLQTLATGGLSELRTAATGGLENVMASGRTTLETVPDIAPTEVPFSLPLATKRPTGSSFADTLQPENIIQSSMREIDPEMTPVADLGYLKTPEDISSMVSGLQSEGGAALTNILGVPEQIGGRIAGAGQEVATTLASTAASTAAKGGAVVTDLASAGTGAATKAASTLQEAGGAAADIVKGAAGDVAETAIEASSTLLPVVGEVTAVALGAYQLYEGFKDLFSHPSAAAPVTVAMPTVANIGQGFQSGI